METCLVGKILLYFDEEYVDIIVVGEADFTFAEIIRRYEKKQDFGSIRGLYLKKDGTRLFTGDYELIDLDEMPIPRRELTANDRDKYFRGAWRPITSMVSSRGCPFDCTFCSLWIVNKGKYRTRKAELVVDEIASIESEYIDFVDDNTIDDLNRSERLTSLLKNRGIEKKYKLYGRPDAVVKRPDLIEKWKDVGLQILLVGLESFRDDEQSALISLLVGSLTIFIIKPLSGSIKVLMDAFIFKDQRRYRQALRNFSQAVTSELNLDVLLGLLVSTVVKAMRISKASLWILDSVDETYSLRASSGLENAPPQKLTPEKIMELPAPWQCFRTSRS